MDEDKQKKIIEILILRKRYVDPDQSEADKAEGIWEWLMTKDGAKGREDKDEFIKRYVETTGANIAREIETREKLLTHEQLDAERVFLETGASENIQLLLRVMMGCDMQRKNEIFGPYADILESQNPQCGGCPGKCSGKK